VAVDRRECIDIPVPLSNLSFTYEFTCDVSWDWRSRPGLFFASNWSPCPYPDLAKLAPGYKKPGVTVVPRE
jgi:hypothetical protein